MIPRRRDANQESLNQRTRVEAATKRTHVAAPSNRVRGASNKALVRTVLLACSGLIGLGILTWAAIARLHPAAPEKQQVSVLDDALPFLESPKAIGGSTSDSELDSAQCAAVADSPPMHPSGAKSGLPWECRLRAVWPPVGQEPQDPQCREYREDTPRKACLPDLPGTGQADQQRAFAQNWPPREAPGARVDAAVLSPEDAVPSQPPKGRPPGVRVSYDAPMPPGRTAADGEAPGRREAEPQANSVPNDTTRRKPERDLPRVAGGAMAPITMHLDDVDVRKALEMLSREAAVSLMISPGVKGRVTVNLTNTSPEEALDAILRLANLVAHGEKGILFVYTPEEYARSDRSIRSFPLDHVGAADVEKAVRSLLSPAGNAFVLQSSPNDNRMARDAIVVEDGQDQLRRVEQCIAQIDRPARQVLIEAHILEVKLEDTKKCGINWNYFFRVMNSNVDLRLHGLADPLAPHAFFVNLKGGDLTALIECLKATSDVKTLASPKLLVMHGQKARIQIGEKIGYRVIMTTETSAMEDVKFMEVGVVLDVSPRISRDRQVALRVKPKVSSGSIDAETKLPNEKTTETETDVLMSDGQGMVIGGLIQEKDDNTQMKIPWLGDIWLVGGLFQRHERVKSRSEIIITLLPRVFPYPPEYEMTEQTETTRAATPLFQGPLCPYPRPWEPSLPSAWRPPPNIPAR